jgi:hypothetical protein
VGTRSSSVDYDSTTQKFSLSPEQAMVFEEKGRRKLMIVEPIAGDRPEDNMNPVERLYYNASTMICVPTSLDLEVGEGLGAQAGETKLTEVIRDGGFTTVRRAAAGRSTWFLRLGPNQILSSLPGRLEWTMDGALSLRTGHAGTPRRFLSALSAIPACTPP